MGLHRQHQPGLVGRREAATSCRLQGRIGARGASPQGSILRCDLETLSWVDLNVNYCSDFVLYWLGPWGGLVLQLLA